MKKIIICVAIAILTGIIVHTACGGEEEDSMALARKAALFIKEHGKEKGFAEIMNPNGSLRKGGLVVTANDFTGMCLAHAASPKLVGRNQYDSSDPDDKYYIREAIRIAKTRGSGWIEWSSTDYETKKIIPLNAWIQRVEGLDVFVMAPVPLQKKWYYTTPGWWLSGS
jgi:cytochrome c